MALPVHPNDRLKAVEEAIETEGIGRLPLQQRGHALTTGGGSGGPVLGTDGRVIAVNYAVLQQFAGSSFGIPVHSSHRMAGRRFARRSTVPISFFSTSGCPIYRETRCCGA
jgi:S1-C subfamily serine protease